MPGLRIGVIPSHKPGSAPSSLLAAAIRRSSSVLATATLRPVRVQVALQSLAVVSRTVQVLPARPVVVKVAGDEDQDAFPCGVPGR
ncbi:hypothetical protein [Micromonospora sp. NPDC049645]|uniref:hypothetical protein n=1 Tax=Micromonospora sp. NPDC049645 TaxID=3155508 RepID=UPI00342FF018